MLTVFEPATVTTSFTCGPSDAMVAAAADSVYRAWLPLIGELGAREQATLFARRFISVERAAS